MTEVSWQALLGQTKYKVDNKTLYEGEKEQESGRRTSCLIQHTDRQQNTDKTRPGAVDRDWRMSYRNSEIHYRVS